MKKKPPLTEAEIHELWRNEGARAAVPLDASWCHTPAPDFIGPVMAGTNLWIARGCPKSAWEVKAEERHVAVTALRVGQGACAADHSAHSPVMKRRYRAPGSQLELDL